VRQNAPENRLDSDVLEKVRLDPTRVFPYRSIAIAQNCKIKTIRAHHAKAGSAVLECVEFVRGHGAAGHRAIECRNDGDHSVTVLEWERSQRNVIEKRQHVERQAEARRHCGHRQNQEARTFNEQSHRILEIEKEIHAALLGANPYTLPF
jgi:hypothetical protein